MWQQSFFFHFAIYGTRRIARAGQTQGWWRPVFCSCQQTAPAASKEETRSFIASGNLKINLWEIFSQLPWVENSVMPGGRKVCRSFSSPLFFFFFLSSFYFGFATIILAVLGDCIRSWTFLILVKLLASMIFQVKNFHRWIEIGVKHCVFVPAQNMSPSSLGNPVVFLTVCIISAWLFGSFRPQWFFVCLLLSLSSF